MEALKEGWNFRLEHPAAWKRLDTLLTAPWAPVIVALTDCGAQLVGLNVNDGRLMFTSISRMSLGMPLRRPSMLLTINGKRV